MLGSIVGLHLDLTARCMLDSLPKGFSCCRVKQIDCVAQWLRRVTPDSSDICTAIQFHSTGLASLEVVMFPRYRDNANLIKLDPSFSLAFVSSCYLVVEIAYSLS